MEQRLLLLSSSHQHSIQRLRDRTMPLFFYINVFFKNQLYKTSFINQLLSTASCCCRDKRYQVCFLHTVRVVDTALSKHCTRSRAQRQSLWAFIFARRLLE